VIRNTLTQLAEFGWYTRRAEILLTRNYTGLCCFTARYARRKGKTVNLGPRLRKPSKAVADLLGIYERTVYQGTEAGQSAHGISVRFV